MKMPKQITIFSFSGLLMHAYEPLHSTYNCSLIPAVLGAYSLNSIIFLIYYIFYRQKPIPMYMTVSVSAIILYLWTISALMDQIPHNISSTWTILLIKTSLCIFALITHFIEILYFYISDEIADPFKISKWKPPIYT